MQEPYQWYVIYVRANAEKRVIDDIKKSELNGEYEVEPFCPETEFYFRNKEAKASGKCYRTRPMFPGYVFIETDMPEKQFLKSYSTYIYNSQDIIRLLRYGKTDRIAIPIEERQRLEYLLKGKRCLTRSVGCIAGDKVQITGGPLVGMEGLIYSVNRHNRTALIKVDILGGTVEVTAALEIVSKT